MERDKGTRIKKHAENAEKQYTSETTDPKKKAARTHQNQTLLGEVPNGKKETSAHGTNKLQKICATFDDSQSENDEEEGEDAVEVGEAEKEARSASVGLNDRNVLSRVEFNKPPDVNHGADLSRNVFRASISRVPLFLTF